MYCSSDDFQLRANDGSAIRWTATGVEPVRRYVDDSVTLLELVRSNALPIIDALESGGEATLDVHPELTLFGRPAEIVVRSRADIAEGDSAA